jgi:hypothetical protein
MPPKLFRQGISRYRSEPFRTDSTKRESARNNNNTVRERCPHDHERSAAQLQRDPVRAQANRVLFQGCSLNGASCPLISHSLSDQGSETRFPLSDGSLFSCTNFNAAQDSQRNVQVTACVWDLAWSGRARCAPRNLCERAEYTQRALFPYSGHSAR